MDLKAIRVDSSEVGSKRTSFIVASVAGGPLVKQGGAGQGLGLLYLVESDGSHGTPPNQQRPSCRHCFPLSSDGGWSPSYCSGA